MYEDRFGLALSTTSAAAAEAYRDGVDRLLAAWPGAIEAFDRAIAIDDRFALAHIARARVHQTYARAVEARASAATARTLAAGATRREQQHVNILALSVEGAGPRALSALLEHLEEFPRDAVAFSLALGAFGLLAFSGRADHDRARVDLCERHADRYGEDWWFLTHRGWSLTEAGHLVAGQSYTERALDLKRDNANAAHALTHALFELGEGAACDAFVEGWLPGYARAGVLNGHISWHAALLALEKGDTARALALYDERIRPGASLAPPLNVLTDAASLLWRVSLNGDVGVELPWSEVADYGERMYGRAGLSFADAHYALAVAASGRRERLDTRIADLEGLDRAGKLPPGSVAVALCRGIAAFSEFDYTGAIEILAPVIRDVVRVGGSGAQRELCEDTLIVACLRCGQTEKAGHLLRARLARRPSPRDSRWLAAANA